MIKKMYIVLHVECPLFFSDFTETWVFLNRFKKNTEIPNFTKIRPLEAELFHADRQTDRQTWRSQ